MLKISKYKSVSLDTNIFIYYFQKNPQFGSLTKNLFQYLFKSKKQVFTSSISLTEILSVKAPLTLINKLQQEILSIPFLNIISVNNDIAIEAARIRRDNFSLPDAIQLATAKFAKAKVFITNDERLKKFKDLQVVLINEIS